MDWVLMAAGLVLLLGGGELLVRGGVALAHAWRLAPVVIGAVVLGFGTSMPELVTSLQAAYRGSPGIAVGNVLGSNIANILLILGTTALLAPIRRGAASGSALWMLLGVTALCVLILLGPSVGRLIGAVLISLLALYMWREISGGGSADPVDIAAAPVWLSLVMVVVGVGLLALGADLLVDAATGIARVFGVAETVIGLTLVAVGTSLPELVTSLVAARRGQGAMALGNVLGSNLFNVLGILGTTALLVPFSVPPMLSPVDLAVFAGTALALVVTVGLAGLGRVAGGVGLGIYAAYMLWLFAGAA